MKRCTSLLLCFLLIFTALLPLQNANAYDASLIPNLSIQDKNIPNNDAMNFVKRLRLGWNLGNTFDAFNGTNITNDLDYEISWSGIRTTKQMIDAVKAKGFNTVRIPVSWSVHVTGSDYKINEQWMNRVQEVVNYCIDNKMYVILNTHHDCDKSRGYFPSSQYLDRSRNYITKVWAQIAARFANYDEHLIFEGMNEPRLVGHANEWWPELTNAEVRDSINCINQLNQDFVNTVRAAGGKNANRYLMVPGYVASPDGATNDYFRLPNDSANGKLIVSVHAYCPWEFCGLAMAEGGKSTWNLYDSKDQSEVTWFMDNVYNKYTSRGIPAIIGECGAVDKNNLKTRVEYMSYYVGQARARGIVCVLWDNHNFSGTGELFGFLDRRSCQFRFEEIIDGMVKYAFPPVYEPDPDPDPDPVIKYGDYNNDGYIDAIDFARFKMYLLDPAHTYEPVLDLNRDNAVDAVDFAVMKQYLLGIISTLPTK
ncbi:cellulase family glycosylhydrolase [Ruminiclostridium herbifermentans]|uniref:cellulase n=1 Tax=Ruminiclostridium herbifermentans TaxID=2488810 RepID=A0A4U7JLF0_9FIRM|nr:cellulase family glycosylhydrolase [Ruminiclostridium herbifermentans]QNU66065.1 cellulase family glycosylhydrolase [Ruminiclostridium herbifermentans]